MRYVVHHHQEVLRKGSEAFTASQLLVATRIETQFGSVTFAYKCCTLCEVRIHE